MPIMRDVSGKPITVPDGMPVTTSGSNNVQETLATGSTIPIALPGLDKVFPRPSASVEHPAATNTATNPIISPAAPPISNTTETAGTIMHYASRYGLLAGGVLATLIIGTVLVKKIIKRKH
jgi:small neutral amino acid transporter SnatA (MarC family)